MIDELRKEILTNLGSDAYVLFLFYQEQFDKYQIMAQDITVAEYLGWTTSKAKRYRDRLTKNNPDYYRMVMLDYYTKMEEAIINGDKIITGSNDEENSLPIESTDDSQKSNTPEAPPIPTPNIFG